MLPVDFLLMVNSIRGRILLIVFAIFLHKRLKIAISEDIGYSDAKTAVYQFKGIDFGANRKRVYTFLLVINSNFSSILHCFGDMAA